MPLNNIKVKPFASGTRSCSDGPGLNTVSGEIQPEVKDFRVDIPLSMKYRDKVSWLALFYKSVPGAIGIGGMKYAFNPAEMKFRRLFWLLLILVALGLLLFQVVDRAKHLSSHPTNVDVYTNHSDSLIFPTVAFCNFNTFKYSLIAGTELESFMYDFTFDHSLVKSLNSSSPYFHYLSNITMADLFTQYGHRAEGTVESAVWELVKVLDRDTYFTTKITDFGLCTVFNDADSGNPPLTIRRPGINNGLQIRLNLEQYEYYFSPFYRVSAGFQMLVYEYGSHALIEDQGFGISPGTHTFVGVDVIETSNLEPPYGLCHDKPLKYFDSYGYSECILECHIDYFSNTCGCVPHGYKNINSIRDCTAWEVFTCVITTWDGYLEDHTCDCPVACRVRSYKPFLSTTQYPSTNWADIYTSNYNLPPDYLKNNIVYVSIYFKEMSIQQITQNKDYGFFSFLCDIGGSLGLWLGGSILTVFEILDLFGNSIYIYSKRFKNVKK